MKKSLVAIAAFVLLLAPSVGRSDSIVGSAGAGWQSWTAGNLDNDGNPYWDNVSFDTHLASHNLNVGYCLTSTGVCNDPPGYGISDAPGAIPFWGQAYTSGTDTGGAADLSFYWQRSTLGSTTPNSAKMKLELAGQKTTNEFGWFSYDPVGGTILSQTTIFTGSDTPATGPKFFTPTDYYGFFLKDPTHDQVVTGGTSPVIYYTLSGFNTPWNVSNDQTTRQHFAVFRDGSSSSCCPSYWIGAEDLPRTLSDFDYNDMIVKVTPIPEPGGLTLLGSALIGLAAVLRRKLGA